VIGDETDPVVFDWDPTVPMGSIPSPRGTDRRLG
jgi:hypothetical protein